VLPLPVIVFAVWAPIYFARHRETARRARFLRTFAFANMAILGGFFALFVAGETLADPGGWQGIGLVLAWAVPLGTLATLGWTRPDQARPLFVLLAGAAVAMSIWFSLDRHGWSTFEDRNGPIRTIASFALLVALSCYAWKRPWHGGWLMLIVSLVPLALATGSPGYQAMVVLNSSSALSAALFLWSVALEGRAGRSELNRWLRRS